MRSKLAALQPPRHLRSDTAVWFTSALKEYELDSHHVRLLTKACEAWDRSEQAREAIAKHGVTYTDRFNSPRSRPECAIERDSRLAFARLVRELGLDVAQESGRRARRIATMGTEINSTKTKNKSSIEALQVTA